MTDLEYQAIDAINISRLKTMRKTPLHFHAQKIEREETPGMRIGRAFHCLTLEPEAFDRMFACFDGYRRGRDWEDFKLLNEGKTILNAPEQERAKGLARAIAGHKRAQELLVGVKESVITWTDRVTGLRCKGRPDCAGAYLVDLKSCVDVQPRRFESTAATLGYHLQSAFYMDGLAENGIRVAQEPFIIAVESLPPHDVVVYRVPWHVIDSGRYEYRDLLNKYKVCTDTGIWPGYSDADVDLNLPAWYDDPNNSPLMLDGAEAAL